MAGLAGVAEVIDHTDVLTPISEAISRLNEIKTKRGDTLKAFSNKSTQFESCIRSLTSRENQLRTKINTAQANGDVAIVRNIEKCLMQSVLRKDELKLYLDCVEEELSALENILNNNKIKVATGVGGLARHTMDASDNRTLLCLFERGSFGDFSKAIEDLSINVICRNQGNRYQSVNSWHNDPSVRLLMSLFMRSAGCDKNDTRFKFLIADKEQLYGSKLLDVRLYDRTDCEWTSFSFPQMQQVILTVTSTSNSIRVRWGKILPYPVCIPEDFTELNEFILQLQNRTNLTTAGFTEFSEFILQHRMNLSTAGWLNPFLSSDPLTASVKLHELKNLLSSTDYEVRLLCRMNDNNLYVPSTTTYIRTLRKNDFDYMPWGVLIRFAVLILAVILGVSLWVGTDKGEKMANNCLSEKA